MIMGNQKGYVFGVYLLAIGYWFVNFPFFCFHKFIIYRVEIGECVDTKYTNRYFTTQKTNKATRNKIEMGTERIYFWFDIRNSTLGNFHSPFH